MIRTNFDPMQIHKYVPYLRFSSAKQNPRSLDQQRDEIERGIKRGGYPWIKVGEYSDDGVSGRRIRSRRGFYAMIRDIMTGVLAVTLILVDTFERFGRAEELESLRRKLHRKHGVLLLTADSNFLDPTSSVGKAVSSVESMRATEENRIKAHNVLRGKRDAVMLKHWGGGPVPRGFQLKSVFHDVKGRQEKSHSVLVPDPETAWIIRLLFDKAHETGWGATRLTRSLNDNPDIPQKFKPFNDQTVGAWLDDSLYYGTYRWNEVCTDIVDERRVIQANDASDIETIEGYCEPLVNKDIWLAVQAVRKARSVKVLAARAAAKSQPDNPNKPIAAGMSVKYLLSGLVRCGECGRVMVATSPAAYTTIAGESRSYAAYRCPFSYSGGCSNRRSVPEAWLRQAVVAALKERLLLPDQCQGNEDNKPLVLTLEILQKQAWFPTMVREIQKEIDRQNDGERLRAPDLAQERSQLEEQMRGWAMSLANSKLPAAVRLIIETELAQASERIQQIDASLARQSGLAQYAEKLLDPETVVDRLNRLSDVLAANNPTRSNLELSLHVDHIDAYPDGRVVLRTCQLGALYDVVDLLALDLVVSAPSPAGSSPHTTALRRRGRLRVVGEDLESDDELDAANYFATDPYRFAGLPDSWFWIDEFKIPEKISWTQSHSIEIAQFRLEHRASLSETAVHFNVCTTTVKDALRKAKSQGVDASDAVLKRPKKPCWATQHADEVEQYTREFHPWATQKTAAEHFHKSLPTIGKALKIARDRRSGATGPAGSDF